MPLWLEKLLPIALLIAVIAAVIARLPRVELGHSSAFRSRRVRNWLPAGLLYAFMYMGRYNLTVSKGVFEKLTDGSGDLLMSNADFGWIFGVGTATYGTAFLLNGPLTDRIGGKRALLLGGVGAALANIALGWVAASGDPADLKLHFTILYAVNMYFQSFGAVGVVKLNAPWFHVRERGVFGAIFGILISLGIYFAFDVGGMIVAAAPVQWVFFVPGVLLLAIVAVVLLVVRDTPAGAGHPDFDTADASSGDDGPRLPTLVVFRRLLGNPIIMTIALIEFCSGFLRQAIMQWYKTFARAVGSAESFVYENFGMLLCCAGILGGMIAGVISDRVYQSRRGPVAALLYGVMLIGAIVLTFVLSTPAVGAVVVFMSMAVIGVHGMLTGTASMDFGGRRNAGTAVGIIDGFVYAGTAVMAFTYGSLLPDAQSVSSAADWIAWPVAMIPMAAIGLGLAWRVWHAIPDAARGAGR